jgi:hypothetical protein
MQRGQFEATHSSHMSREPGISHDSGSLQDTASHVSGSLAFSLTGTDTGTVLDNLGPHFFLCEDGAQRIR